MADRQTQKQHHRDRPTVGADLPGNERPGVPMEHEPRRLTPTAHEFERMRPQPNLTHRKAARGLTPVYGTAQPPRGLSGLVKRLAYAMPETHARHWLLLLVSDRINVLEYKLGRALKVLAIAPAAIAGVVLAVRFVRS